MRSVLPPAGACDCHVHVIGPKARFPLQPKRSYTPMDAPLSALEAMMARLRLDRAVIVQPSIYGTDNSCTLDALDNLGERARGVAVVAATTPGSELDALHTRGVRGVRINVVSGGVRERDALRRETAAVADLCARNGWHLQLYLAPAMLDALAEHLRALPVTLVFDHFGMIRPDNPHAGGLAALERLMGEGRAFVKLSGVYRVCEDTRDPALGALARRLVAANVERVVWASDWPHTPAHEGAAVSGDRELPYRDLDTAGLLRELHDWIGSAADLRRILVENPAELYDFSRGHD